MRFLNTLIQQVLRWIIAAQPAGYHRQRRMLLEQLQPRVLLAGLPANEAWQQVSGTLIESNSSGAYIQLTPSASSNGDQATRPAIFV